MILVKFTRKAVCLIYSLFLVNAVCLGPAYCMYMDLEEEESTWQKWTSSLKRRTGVWQAERNGEVIRFIEEVGKTAQFKGSIDLEEQEEEKKTTVKNRRTENTPVIIHPASLTTINVETIEEEEGEEGFLIINRRVNITLSNPTVEDEKTINAYYVAKGEYSYDSLHLTFKELKPYTINTLPAYRMCSAAASLVCPNIKEFIFEGPYIRKALSMIWKHCPNIERLSLTSQNLPEILEELCAICEVDAELDVKVLKKLTHVVLMGESSPELCTKLRNSFLSIAFLKVNGENLDKRALDRRAARLE